MNKKIMKIIRAIGLSIFIFGLALIMAVSIAFEHENNMFIIGFLIGLAMIIFGGFIIIRYVDKEENKNETIN